MRGQGRSDDRRREGRPRGRSASPERQQHHHHSMPSSSSDQRRKHPPLINSAKSRMYQHGGRRQTTQPIFIKRNKVVASSTNHNRREEGRGIMRNPRLYHHNNHPIAKGRCNDGVGSGHHNHHTRNNRHNKHSTPPLTRRGIDGRGSSSPHRRSLNLVNEREDTHLVTLAKTREWGEPDNPVDYTQQGSIYFYLFIYFPAHSDM